MRGSEAGGGDLVGEGTVGKKGEVERFDDEEGGRMVRSCLRRRPSEGEGEGLEELPLAKRPRRRRD